ncbi:uncharacterized protein [Notamacropus eugenii]|uniref:uncharacterized protein n=1 Tax=Notamacropus eugenii TaxID=9315 RepID=UPI003B677CAC
MDGWAVCRGGLEAPGALSLLSLGLHSLEVGAFPVGVGVRLEQIRLSPSPSPNHRVPNMGRRELCPSAGGCPHEGGGLPGTPAPARAWVDPPPPLGYFWGLSCQPPAPGFHVPPFLPTLPMTHILPPPQPRALGAPSLPPSLPPGRPLEAPSPWVRRESRERGERRPESRARGRAKEEVGTGPGRGDGGRRRSRFFLPSPPAFPASLLMWGKRSLVGTMLLRCGALL